MQNRGKIIMLHVKTSISTTKDNDLQNFSAPSPEESVLICLHGTYTIKSTWPTLSK